ncbi:MAG TPA: hypothetical protein VFR97_09215 [Capillimicrobium sp.]|nr:hypothetical protein [Capillimicrobium sp.]
MTRVFFGWGLLMGAIGLVGLLAFGFESPENLALFGGVLAVMVGLAAGLWASGLGRNEVAGARALPDVSPPVPLLALAITLAAVGAEYGLWLTLIGGGLGLFALGGLLREVRAQRAALAEEEAARR